MTPSVRAALVGDQRLLRALLDNYLVELSRYAEVDRAYPWFDAYWQPGEPRWPYLIEDADSHTVGFALVNAYTPAGVDADFSMAEFYISPSERRRSLGRHAAVAIFRRHPGKWALAVMPGNSPAMRFWPLAISEAGASEVEQTNVKDSTIHRFRIG